MFFCIKPFISWYPLYSDPLLMNHPVHIKCPCYPAEHRPAQYILTFYGPSRIWLMLCKDYCNNESIFFNQDDGLGTYSLSIIYGALILSSQFTPSLAIKHLGTKWTMVLCMLCYNLYIGAQFYPRSYTLLPAAVILGFAAAPLWISKCAYLTKVLLFL